MQNSAMEEGIIRHYIKVADMASQGIESSYVLQKWPFEILREITEDKFVLFWWIVNSKGEIILADDTQLWHKSIKLDEREGIIVEDSFYYKTGEAIKLIIHPLSMGGKKWKFYMGISLDPIIEARNGMILAGVGILSLMSLAAFFISSSFSKHVTRPIKKLIEGARAISKGNLDYKIHLKSGDETGKLAEVFNKMTIDLKRSREELERYSKSLEDLLKHKNEFINQLGHDLKNPLNPLINLLPLIETRDQKSRERLEVVMRNVDFMKNLVTKTIDLAKLNSPTTIFCINNLNLAREVEEVVEKHKPLLEENEMEVENKINEDIIIKADKLRLEEVFDNLISNAIKYTPKGGKIIFDAKKEKGMVTISVKDTGIGMDRVHLEHIFEEFYKADSSRHDLSSCGLGLSICKRIIEKHGGKIWAQSPGRGKGTTMFFTIPSLSEIGLNREVG
jgi:signal transduction histidine kinase